MLYHLARSLSRTNVLLNMNKNLPEISCNLRPDGRLLTPSPYCRVSGELEKD